MLQIHKIVQVLYVKECVFTFGEVKNILGAK